MVAGLNGANGQNVQKGAMTVNKNREQGHVTILNLPMGEIAVRVQGSIMRNVPMANGQTGVIGQIVKPLRKVSA